MAFGLFVSTKNLPLPLLLLYNSRSVLLIVEAFSLAQQLNTFACRVERLFTF